MTMILLTVAGVIAAIVGLHGMARLSLGHNLTPRARRSGACPWSRGTPT